MKSLPLSNLVFISIFFCVCFNTEDVPTYYISRGFIIFNWIAGLFKIIKVAKIEKSTIENE